MTVSIRPYSVDDAVLVWQAAMESVAELEPWMSWCHPDYAIEESHAWLAEQMDAFQRRTAFEFAIRDGEQYVGGCGLNQLDELNRRANLGYWVRTSASRRGIATRAVELVRDWAFRETGLERLEIVVAVENLASQRVAEKAGATREGVLRRRLRLHGVLHAAVMFSLTR